MAKPADLGVFHAEVGPEIRAVRAKIERAIRILHQTGDGEFETSTLTLVANLIEGALKLLMEQKKS